jgi:hypothetical protein
MRKRSNLRWWGLWAAVTLLLTGIVYAAIDSIDNPKPGPADLVLRSWLLPGETSHGHYQIELACNECRRHASPATQRI